MLLDINLGDGVVSSQRTFVRSEIVGAEVGLLRFALAG